MSSLTQYIELKKQADALKGQMAALKQAAIDEAQDLAQQKGAQTFGHAGAKITLRFRTYRPGPKDDQTLETLDQLLQLEREKAQSLNGISIKSIQTKMRNLEIELERLEMTDEGRKLQQEFDERQKLIAEKRPELAIKGV